MGSYTHGHPTELIRPDNWNMDLHYLDRPNARCVQLDFFYDYRTNVLLYPQWQTFLRERQPKTIIFWGQDDIFFTREGGESYLKDLKDLPSAEMHRLNSGHFAVEDLLAHHHREDDGFLQKGPIGLMPANYGTLEDQMNSQAGPTRECGPKTP